MVYYAISVPKGRTKVHDYLESQGFERIQYSVFVGRIEARHWKRVWRQLSYLFETYCVPEDKIYSHLIEADHFRHMLVLGEPIDIAYNLQDLDIWSI